MNSHKHLLVIRLSAMGDVAMTIPVISALLEQHPELEITVLTRDFFKPLFYQLPNVKVYVADVNGKHKGVIGLWKLYKELKAYKFDAIVDLHNVLRSNILKVFFKLGSFRLAQIDKGRIEKKALISDKNKVFKPLKTTHERYADVFRTLGFSMSLEHAPPLPKRILSEKSKGLFADENTQVIGVAPFAAFEGKMYPLDLMEKVIEKLNALKDFRILLFGGGEKERKQLDIWEKSFENVFNTIGKLTFTEEIDSISNLDAMLAMDSGNAHLAALFNVPTITLWGVTHPYAGFYPFGQNIENALLADRHKFPLIPTSVYGDKMPNGYDEAMRSIHPEEVIKKLQLILEKK
jgi:ADP-heptose:LPS heptosyltransferase